MLSQPVAEDVEEAVLANLGRSVKVTGKRSHRLLVDFEEQAVLAAEVLKDGTLGNAEGGGDVADPGGMVPLFGEMTHGGVNNAGPLAFGTGARRHMTVTRRRNQATSNPTHILTSSQETVPKMNVDFNSIFRGLAVM